MEYDTVLVRYGELFLKGGNIYYFERRLRENIKSMTGVLPAMVRGRMILPYFQDHHALCRVFGIASYSPAYRVDKNIESIQKKAIAVLEGKSGTFKVDTKRSDKRFPLLSPQINRQVGQYIEEHTSLRFQFAAPDMTLYIEINNAGVYLYTEIVSGLGGLPVGTAGKVQVVMESEADLLAGLLMMKRGCEIIALVVGKVDIGLLQKFSPKAMKPMVFEKEKYLQRHILEKNISFIITGETLETKKDGKGILILRPLIVYTREQIREELEKYKALA